MSAVGIPRTTRSISLTIHQNHLCFLCLCLQLCVQPIRILSFRYPCIQNEFLISNVPRGHVSRARRATVRPLWRCSQRTPSIVRQRCHPLDTFVTLWITPIRKVGLGCPGGTRSECRMQAPKKPSNSAKTAHAEHSMCPQFVGHSDTAAPFLAMAIFRHGSY